MEGLTYTLNDIEQYFNRYTSDCAFCLHFDESGFTCPAFTDGIPIPLLSGKIKHRKVLETQDNDIVFEKEEEEE